jgi:predicted nucleotidyltransferase component of viral defense system
MEQHVDDSAVDLAAWVEEARSDPVAYRRRQVAHILLHAIATTPALKQSLFLKGGILMALAYRSVRSTSDIDFTTREDPDAFAGEIRGSLDRALRRAVGDLAYPLACKVQSTRKEPKLFPVATAPSLEISIASAARGTNEEIRLQNGQAPQVLWMEVSFKEPVEAVQDLVVGNAMTTVKAYARVDLIAEKLRALLQQPVRKRSRRQDVYDLAYLLDADPPDEDERAEILRILRIKSQARGLDSTYTSMRHPEIYERAKSEWATMQAELTDPLPDFDGTFRTVLEFYESLPWPQS